jgi:hypothetical protein
MRLRDRLVLGLVGHGRGRIAGAVIGLRVRGRRTGAWHELPVQYAWDGPDLIAFPGHPERKRWWRNLDEPAPVQVLVAGSWHPGTGRVVRPSDPSYATSVRSYRQRFPHADVPEDAPLVRIALGG